MALPTCTHTHTCTHTSTHTPGSLDRCVDGETAKIILEKTPPPVTQDQVTTSQSVPLQVRSLCVSDSDSLIQVMIFEPQNLINRLSKMEKLSKEVPKKKEAPKKQEAFKMYLMARKQFGAGRYMSLYLCLFATCYIFTISACMCRRGMVANCACLSVCCQLQVYQCQLFCSHINYYPLYYLIKQVVGHCLATKVFIGKMPATRDGCG